MAGKTWTKKSGTKKLEIKRYGIYLAKLDPTIGSELGKTRPIVTISDDLFNKHLDVIVACPLTTSLHPSWRGRIQIICAGKPAEIAADRIRTLSKQRLIRKIDELSSDDALTLRLLITEMYGESL
jgi:mRNA interferase MazF